MKNFLRFWTLISSSFLVLLCSSQKNQDQPPEWVLKPPMSTDQIFIVATGDDKTEALVNALCDLSNSIGSEVDSKTETDKRKQTVTTTTSSTGELQLQKVSIELEDYYLTEKNQTTDETIYSKITRRATLTRIDDKDRTEIKYYAESVNAPEGDTNNKQIEISYNNCSLPVLIDDLKAQNINFETYEDDQNYFIKLGCPYSLIGG